MKVWKFSEPWMANFLFSEVTEKTFQKQHPKSYSLKSYMTYQLHGLAFLSRNIMEYVETHKIKGDAYSERLCLFVLARLDRFADFSLLVGENYAEPVLICRQAKIRLTGLKLPKVVL